MPKKTFDHSSFHSMTHLAVSFPSWCNSNEQQMPQSLSKSISLKVESTPKLFNDGKYLGLQLPHQESSSAQSIGQSHNEMGQDESCGKSVEGRMKLDFLMSNSEIIFNQPHIDYNHSMAHSSYAYDDRYFGGLFSPYGPQALIHPQIGAQLVRIAPARVPMLLDPVEDGPIYVNPKQYHGILRRRKSRAKLEAQNRNVKTRKPYLHESRHLHALNRIRGSGGRFLSTKKHQHHDRNSTSTSNDFLDSTPLCQKNKRVSELESCLGNEEYVASTATSSDIAIVSNSDSIFRQPADCGFSDISVHMQNNGRQSARWNAPLCIGFPVKRI